MRLWLILAVVLVLCGGCGIEARSWQAFQASMLLEFDHEHLETDAEVAALVDLIIREGEASDARGALDCPLLTREQRHALIEVVAGHSIEVDDLVAARVYDPTGGGVVELDLTREASQ